MSDNLDIDKNIDIFIEEQFSANYRENGSLLVEFIRCYYKWAEENENFISASRLIYENYDVDTIADKFLDFLQDEFLAIFPKDLKTNKRTLIKNILKFYQAKGTEDSYKLLFRILYNKEINLYYPGKDILRASDGKWYVGRKLIILNSYDGELTDIPEIVGLSSKATARIENVVANEDSDSLYIVNIKGNFIKNEDIAIKGNESVILGIVLSDGVVSDPGYWLNTDGQLSSDKYLQDNFYYQDFSYEIQSEVSLIEYQKIVNDILHPAGTKLFGKVLNSFIIDATNLDVIFESGFTYANDDYILDVSQLAIDYDNVIEFEGILDKNIQELAGLGKVSINTGILSDFSDFLLSDFGAIPMGMLGSRKTIVGTGTSFNLEVAQQNGVLPGQTAAKIKVLDTDNNATLTYSVDTNYSDRILTITEDYYYPSFLLENYNIIRSFDVIEFGGNDYISVIGSGTLTWNNGTQSFDGTLTAFTLEIKREDIIEIISTGQQFMATDRSSDINMNIIRDGTLSLTINNEPYKIYRNLDSTDDTGGPDTNNYMIDGVQYLLDNTDYIVEN